MRHLAAMLLWRPALLAALSAALLPTLLPAQDAEPVFRPFDRAAFEQHARSLGADEARITRFRQESAAVSPAQAADELLQELLPDYDTAIELYLDADPRAVLALARLSNQDDPWLRAHARYHLGRAFLDIDDPENAVEILTDYLRYDRNRSPLDAEAAFFYATALADIPRSDIARQAFADYLQLFPDAPERMRALAAQRKAELESQLQNPLHDIADEMKAIERELGKGETGEPTQQRQLEVVTELERIIEQLEQQEQQSTGAASNNQPSSSPAEESVLPGGESRIGDLRRMPGLVDRWGAMKDRDRKAIEAEVQTKLPPRYRALIEDYFEKLGKGGER